MVKVVFLDFDGVLNSLQSNIMYKRIKKDDEKRLFMFIGDWCPIACSNVQYLLEKVPDLKIVVSSSWRNYYSMDELKEILQTIGIDSTRVIDKTPRNEVGRAERGYEIQKWLDGHPEVTEFVILDDDSDMVHLSDRHVHTSFMHGFQFGDVQQALRLLKEPTDKSYHDVEIT